MELLHVQGVNCCSYVVQHYTQQAKSCMQVAFKAPDFPPLRSCINLVASAGKAPDTEKSGEQSISSWRALKYNIPLPVHHHDWF